MNGSAPDDRRGLLRLVFDSRASRHPCRVSVGPSGPVPCPIRGYRLTTAAYGRTRATSLASIPRGLTRALARSERVALRRSSNARLAVRYIDLDVRLLLARSERSDATRAAAVPAVPPRRRERRAALRALPLELSRPASSRSSSIRTLETAIRLSRRRTHELDETAPAGDSSRSRRRGSSRRVHPRNTSCQPAGPGVSSYP